MLEETGSACRDLCRPRSFAQEPDSARINRTYNESTVFVGLLERTRRKTSLGRLLPKEETPQSAEAWKWIRVLRDHAQEAGLPICKLSQLFHNLDMAWGRVLGTRRVKTLRTRAMTWGNHLWWPSCSRGRCWPTSIHDVADYLDETTPQGCGSSLPADLSRSLGLLAIVGRVAANDRLATDPTLKAVVASMKEQLQQVHHSRSLHNRIQWVLVALGLYVGEQANCRNGRALG